MKKAKYNAEVNYLNPCHYKKAPGRSIFFTCYFFIFESESLAIVIRGEMESKSFHEQFTPKIKSHADVTCIAAGNML